MATWKQLSKGDGWTPAHFVRLREMLGDNGKPIPRTRLGARIGLTERTLFRIETGQTTPSSLSLKAIIEEAAKLPKEQREQLAEVA